MTRLNPSASSKRSPGHIEPEKQFSKPSESSVERDHLQTIFLSISGSPLLLKAVQERDEQVRRIRDEAAQTQKRFQHQREEDCARLAESREQLERLSLRKEELKQQLVDKDVELEETKRVHRQVHYI